MALFTEGSVLVRTEEGEAAARQPRRVASNRARAALLLLDGELSVGEMKRRFGESLEVEDALMELLRDGLAVDRDDAVTDPEEDLPVVDEMIPPDGPPTEMPPDPELSLPPGFVVAGRQPAAPKGPVADDMVPIELPPDRLTETGERIEPEVDIDASISAAYADEKPKKKASRRAGEPSFMTLFLDRLRFYLTRLFRGAVALGIAAVIGVVLVLLWQAPEWFRGEIEGKAREVAGAEVSIAELGPAWDEGPALRLAGVTVGADAERIEIHQVRVRPDWTSLGQSGSLALGVRILGVEGRPTLLAAAFNRADFGRVAAARVQVEDLRLQLSERLTLVLQGEGEVSHGVLQRLTLSSGGEGPTYRVPLPMSFPIELSGNADGWRPPFLEGVALESLQFDGLLYDEGLQVISAGGALHGGRYGGTMEIAWQQQPVALQGDFQLESVRLERLMPAMRSGGDLEGGLSGTMTLKAEAERFGGLGEAMTVAGALEISNGRLGGLDVGAIMRERGTGLVRGGATRFESIKLDVSMDMKDRNLRAAIRSLDAGNLHVGGGLLIKPNDELSGRLTSTLASGSRRVSLPVVVTGTLGSPALRLAPEAIQ